MRKKYKIDEIYREKLKGIETTPPEDSWENILTGLPKKNKRIITPIWYGLVTTAAVLAILFSVFKDFQFYTPQSSSSPVIAEQEKQIFNPDPTSTVFIKSMNEANYILETIRIKNEILNGIYLKVRSSGVTSGLADLPTLQSEKQRISEVSSSSLENISQSDLVGTYSSEETVSGNSKSKLLRIQLDYHPLVTNEFDIRGSKFLSEMNNPLQSEILEKPIEEGENSLAENTRIENRFSFTTTAGAVYLDQFGKGNFFASQFDENEEDGKMTASYGVHVAYQLSEKVKIRGGLNKIDFSYSTQNLSYLAVLNSQVATRPLNQSNEVESGIPGSLDQNFGFLEIPLEIEYALIKRKIELNLIGGGSSFILQKNNLSFTNGTTSADLGEGRNLENLNFSANLGLGLTYHLTGKFQFNLEPIFKYQFNTFKNSSNANSYYLGIYSGLRFKF